MGRVCVDFALVWNCIDYRPWNEITTKDQFALPRIDERVDSLTAAEIVSTWDLPSGYYQVAIAETDRYKTPFVCQLGRYEFIRGTNNLYLKNKNTLIYVYICVYYILINWIKSQWWIKSWFNDDRFNDGLDSIWIWIELHFDLDSIRFELDSTSTWFQFQLKRTDNGHVKLNKSVQ